MRPLLKFAGSLAVTRYRSWRGWARAGRPVNGPVVQGEGQLLKCPVCRRCGFRGWRLDFTHVARFLSTQDMWDYLSTLHPHVWEMCPSCLEARKGRLLW